MLDVIFSKLLIVEDIEAQNGFSCGNNCHKNQEPFLFVQNHMLDTTRFCLCNYKSPTIVVSMSLYLVPIPDSMHRILIYGIEQQEILIKRLDIAGAKSMRIAHLKSLHYSKSELGMVLVPPSQSSIPTNSICEWVILGLLDLYDLKSKVGYLVWRPKSP
jgi:hypothetical protein